MIEALAYLSLAVSDYENAWRDYAASTGDARERAWSRMADALRHRDSAERALARTCPNAAAVRGALTIASARVQRERPAEHTAHLGEPGYAESFIRDAVAGRV